MPVKVKVRLAVERGAGVVVEGEVGPKVADAGAGRREAPSGASARRLDDRSVASWVFVYVQVTASPGSRAMLARPVARVGRRRFEQTRLVRVQPATGRVSVIVLVPVASAPVKVKVRLFGVPDVGVVVEEEGAALRRASRRRCRSS